VSIPDERLEAVLATRFCNDHEVLWEGNEVTLSLPEGVYSDGAAAAEGIAAREAARHLKFLPTDDESDTVEQLGPEEQALHTTYLGTTMSEILDPAEWEMAEMQEAGVQSDERIEAQREEDSRRAETEVVIVEEEELSEASSSRRQPWLWRRRRQSVAGRGSR